MTLTLPGFSREDPGSHHPHEFKGSEPIDVYAMNNPTYFLDPSGNISISTIWNNKYGRPAVNKTVDAAISVSDYASTIAKLAGEGSSDAGQSLDAAAQVGGAVVELRTFMIGR